MKYQVFQGRYRQLQLLHLIVPLQHVLVALWDVVLCLRCGALVSAKRFRPGFGEHGFHICLLQVRCRSLLHTLVLVRMIVNQEHI